MNTKNQLLEIARSTIAREIATLKEVHQALSDSFYDAVMAIIQTNGRLIITGMGKSAIIGQKIVATLNSTGTPSAFMHAADAAHGDLGILSEHDILLFISKSGETDEFKVIIPLIKSMKNKTIAFVSKTGSYLDTHVDISIFIPVTEEADPHNLAPTSSTTAQLAVGDALAVALLSQRGFTEDQFAILHPGGNIGKKLILKVEDLCARNEVPAVNEQASFHETIMEMTRKRLGATAVLDQKLDLKGIITDGDLRRMLELKKEFTHLKAADIMTRNPKTIFKNQKAVDALAIMKASNITQLLVLDTNGHYMGVIHIHDIINEGLL